MVDVGSVRVGSAFFFFFFLLFFPVFLLLLFSVVVAACDPGNRPRTVNDSDRSRYWQVGRKGGGGRVMSE